MSEDQRSIDAAKAAAQSAPELPGVKSMDVLVGQSRTHLLRATGPRSTHVSVMRLPRGEIRGVGSTGARSLAPEPDSFHKVTSGDLTGGIIFNGLQEGGIKA